MNRRALKQLYLYSVALTPPPFMKADPAYQVRLFKLLKRWWNGLDHRSRGIVRKRMTLRKPLHHKLFIGAPYMLGKLGAIKVDTPTPKSRLKRMKSVERRKRKIRKIKSANKL